MTGRDFKSGEKRLYEESVTPRNSLAFNILTLIGGKAIAWMGMVADKGLDALGIGRYFRTPEMAGRENEQKGYQTEPVPAMAAGYKMAMARQTIPLNKYTHSIESGYMKLATNHNTGLISIDEYMNRRKSLKEAA